jgi:hypothetical protein
LSINLGVLRVGFGEAGAGIISANLSAKDSSTAINPLLPGVRVYAIFGFCDIHHFEDINRKLGNDVLKFVNQIAEIVHSRYTSVHIAVEFSCTCMCELYVEADCKRSWQATSVKCTL